MRSPSTATARPPAAPVSSRSQVSVTARDRRSQVGGDVELDVGAVAHDVAAADDHVGHVGGRRGGDEHRHRVVGVDAGEPDGVEVDGAQVRRLHRRAGRPPPVAAASSAPGWWMPAPAGAPEPLVELDGSGLLEQVDDGMGVGAEPDRAAGVGAARPPDRRRRPRSRSVVGQRQTAVPLRPSSAMSPAVTCVAVHGGGRRAEDARGRRRAPQGVRPVAARHASFSAGCSDRWRCSGTPRAARPVGHHAPSTPGRRPARCGRRRRRSRRGWRPPPSRPGRPSGRRRRR